MDFFGPMLIDQFASLPDSIKKRRMMDEQFQPREDSLNSLIELIKRQPQRNEPSKFNRITAALASLGGVGPAGISSGQPVGFQANVPMMNKIQEDMLYKKYNRDTEDFNAKLDPALKLANIESQRNQSARIAHDQQMEERRLNERLDLDRTKAEATNRYNNARTENTAREIKRKEDYDQFRQAQAANPNFKSFIDSDGFVVMIDMKDPTKQVRTNVDTKEMSDLQKLEFGRTSQLMALRERASAASELEDKKQTNRIALEDKKETTRADTTKTLSPSQQARDKYNRANDIKNLYPELAPYIKLGTNMVVDIPSVSKINELLGRRSDADRTKAIDALYPKEKKNLTGVNSEVNSPASTSRVYTEAEARAILKRDKKPETPEMIAFVLKQLNGGK